MAMLGAALVLWVVTLSPTAQRARIARQPAVHPVAAAAPDQAVTDPTMAGYPAFMVVCRARTTPACATIAAERVGHPIAWLPTSPQADATTLVAVKQPRPWANQDLAGHDFVTSLSSPGLGRPPGTLASLIRRHGTVLELRIGPGRQLTLEWTHARRPFRLSVAARGSTSPHLAQMLRLWRTVRYSAPR